jgi:class 3 adenylate cyclase
MKPDDLKGPYAILEQQLAEALEQQTATAGILRVISQSPTDIEPVLQAVADTAAGLCRADEAAVFPFKDGAYRWAASANIASAYVEAVQGEAFTPGNDSLVGRTALRGEVVQIADALTDPDYGRLDLIRKGDARTLLGVPLQRDGATIGVMVPTRRRVERFIDQHLDILKVFADQAVIAIENVRLFNEVQALNKGLEAKVAAQVSEFERVGRLRRFLAPQLAQAIVSAGDESILSNHRREIVALFCDLRGFTAFSETSEPEDIMQLLAEYHGALGPLIRSYEGTLDRFTGDDMMVFFNDPLPCLDAPERASRLAIEMRDAVARLGETWRKRGHRLGFGIGMAQGYATLGRIGFEDRFDYTAIGAVINLAARLCAEAADGEVLVSGRLAAAAEAVAEVEELGERHLKGMARLKETEKWGWNNLRPGGVHPAGASGEKGETQMSDYIPNPPNPERDPRNYDRYYEDNSGKGVTLVVGILVAIALAAGLMFFAGSPNERTDQAQVPAQERTMTPPVSPATPATPPAAPARPAANPQQ